MEPRHGIQEYPSPYTSLPCPRNDTDPTPPFAKQNGTKRVLFDVPKDGQNIAPKYVAPEDEQEPYESRRYVIAASKLRLLSPVRLGGPTAQGTPFYRLWHKLTQAIEAKDMEAATRAKTAVEDAQRDLRRRRDESGEVFVPRFFQLRDGRWCPKLRCVVAIPPLGFLTVIIETCVPVPVSIDSIPQDSSDTAIHTVESWMWPSA